MKTVDDHGQPLRPFPTALMSNHGKAVDQLIGIACGIMCDGEVSDTKARAFRGFVERFYQEDPTFPFDLLKQRLDKIFADGVVSDDERAELRDILRSLGGLTADTSETVNVSCSFPLDVPPPAIVFPDREFVVTGRFAYGTRHRVHDAIIARGGCPAENVRQATRYLVIGHYASRDWIHTSYGLKIQRAAELRGEHCEISIVSEEHWASFLD